MFPTANDSNSIPVGSLAVVTGNVVNNDTERCRWRLSNYSKIRYTANGLDVTIDQLETIRLLVNMALTIHSDDGSYSYARNAGSAGGVKVTCYLYFNGWR